MKTRLYLLDRYIIGKFLGTFIYTILLIIVIAVIFDLTEKSLGLAWVYIMTTEQAIKFGGIVEPDGHWRNPSKAKIAN